jgi:hypothetical protein
LLRLLLVVVVVSVGRQLPTAAVQRQLAAMQRRLAAMRCISQG